MQLADTISGTDVARPAYRKAYRGKLGFVMDELAHSTRLDRNTKARLLHACEVMERATKAKGRRNGALGLTGLAVLRTLLLRFHNAGSGLCCPSYDALQKVTGFCRQTIAKALAVLERIGVLVVTRRLVRTFCHASGTVVVRQGCNIYAFRDLPARVPLDVLAKSARPFPKPRVYGIAAKYAAQAKLKEERALPVSANWLGNGKVPVDADWRTKARAMFAARR